MCSLGDHYFSGLINPFSAKLINHCVIIICIPIELTRDNRRAIW